MICRQRETSSGKFLISFPEEVFCVFGGADYKTCSASRTITGIVTMENTVDMAKISDE